MIRRGIDHVVLCVSSLERARAFYASLGFKLTPTALHPFGTANSLVQLNGNFIELLEVADASLIHPPEPGHFSFAYHNKSFLERGEGCSMLVFEGHDARADQAEFRLKKMDTYEPFDFSRAAKLPGGEAVTVGFSLAFVTHPEMPHTAFFTCQQHAPEHFWKGEYQTHDNTAHLIASAVMLAEYPHRYAEFFRALQGTDAVTETASGLRVVTARGDVQIMHPQAFRERFAAEDAPEHVSEPYFHAMVIEVADLGAVAGLVRANGVKVQQSAQMVRVPAALAFGCDIVFVGEHGA